MFRRRKFLILTSLLVLICAGLLIFIWTNINWMVKTAIEKYGSQSPGPQFASLRRLSNSLSTKVPLMD
jgi:phosphotransferase system  glucose/maltose/N-acetylglucosamine-specific IIC component